MQQHRLKQAAALWWAGVWDALQLQRCVVFCVLDGSGVILSRVGECFLVNGAIYLGSVICHGRLVEPTAEWLLQTYAEPALGPAASDAVLRALRVLFHAVWLLPVYVITLIVSCIWYQQMAVAAFEVKRRQQQQQQQQQNGSSADGPRPAALPAQLNSVQKPLLGAPPGSSSSSGSGSSGSGGGGGGAGQALEGVAQELYRVLLFLVFSVEVTVLGLLPYYAGLALNIVFLSWLYAFYCFDYTWGLQGVPLPERIAFFEQRWAFFAGFGLPCTLPALLLPYPINAAVLNLLFPVFVLVACASDPAATHARLAWSPTAGRIPIFGMALRPTAAIIGGAVQRLAPRMRHA